MPVTSWHRRSFKAANDIPVANPLLSLSTTFLGTGAAIAAIAAYYAPTFALTELMRQQRASIVPQENKPSKLHFFGPGLVQSLTIFGFLLASDWIREDIRGTYKTIVPTLALSLLINPGLIAALHSSLEEWEENIKTQAKERKQSWEESEKRWQEFREWRRKWLEQQPFQEEGIKHVPCDDNISNWYESLKLKQGDEEMLPRENQITNVKTAYRTLAMRWHPDRNPGDKDSENKFKEVDTAYQGLKRKLGLK